MPEKQRSMKVSAIETFPLAAEGGQGAYGAPYGFVVKVTTAEGLVGYGETDSMPSVVEAVIGAPFVNEMMSGLGCVLTAMMPTRGQPGDAWRRRP